MLWNDETVRELNKFQCLGVVHPYTCGGMDGSKECRENLVATRNGWICFRCGYTQNWAHQVDDIETLKNFNEIDFKWNKNNSFSTMKHFISNENLVSMADSFNIDPIFDVFIRRRKEGWWMDGPVVDLITKNNKYITETELNKYKESNYLVFEDLIESMKAYFEWKSKSYFVFYQNLNTFERHTYTYSVLKESDINNLSDIWQKLKNNFLTNENMGYIKRMILTVPGFGIAAEVKRENCGEMSNPDGFIQI